MKDHVNIIQGFPLTQTPRVRFGDKFEVETMERSFCRPIGTIDGLISLMWQEQEGLWSML